MCTPVRTSFICADESEVYHDIPPWYQGIASVGGQQSEAAATEVDHIGTSAAAEAAASSSFGTETTAG